MSDVLSVEVMPQPTEVEVLSEQNTLASRMRQWMEMMRLGLEKSTQRRYQFALNNFVMFVRGRAITPALWAEYQQHMLNSGRKASTAHKESTILRQFFGWCHKHQFISINPCHFSIKMPPVVVKKMPTFTHDEYEAMKKRSMSMTHMHWLVVASYATGASVCDIALMRWSMVDMDNLVISFIRRKTKRYQTPATIPFEAGTDIHKDLLILAEEREGSDPQQYVCPVLAHRYLHNPCLLPNAMRYLLKQCGIDVTCKSHKTFRWTFISNWANSGLSTSMGCQIVGTKNPAIFTRYVTPDTDSMRQGIRDMMERSRQRSENARVARIK